MDKTKVRKPKVKRKKQKISRDPSRVIARPHIPDDQDRRRRIIQHIIDLDDTESEELLTQIMLDFSERHKNIRSVLSDTLI